ncbi:uncharacterized protein [Amphiura filiformis]|uniref:uncharacterized protein n=1 Tax=Amphiura filiformis TaxID=82378 RepID=UPI003B20D2E5
MNSSSQYKEDADEAKPSHDPGGGGDMTFHQMKEENAPESRKDDKELPHQKRILDGLQTNEDVDRKLEDDDCAKVNEERQDADGKEKSTSHGTGREKMELSDEVKGQKKEDGDKFDLRDPRKLDRQQRSNVYNKACVLQQEGKNDEALKHYVAAITGLTENNSFHELPQCLHHVSNIYFEKNEYEKAVHFIQAEKMYYETALLDIVNLQKQISEKQKQKQGDGDTSPGPETSTKDAHQTSEEVIEAKDANPEITKAKELENLARLCLKEGKPQLALEYCGKATKIYRSQLGDDHPVTVGSLDLFALVYADVGKKLYQDAMMKFGVDEVKEGNNEIKATSQQESSTAQDGSVTGIRQRNKPGKEALVKPDQRRSERQVRLEEYEPSPPASEQDDWVTTVLLMILFFLITVLVALIFSFFYCRNNERSEMCAEFKGDLTYWFMKIQHTVKYYTSSGRR